MLFLFYTGLIAGVSCCKFDLTTNIIMANVFFFFIVKAMYTPNEVSDPWIYVRGICTVNDYRI